MLMLKLQNGKSKSSGCHRDVFGSLSYRLHFTLSCFYNFLVQFVLQLLLNPLCCGGQCHSFQLKIGFINLMCWISFKWIFAYSTLKWNPENNLEVGLHSCKILDLGILVITAKSQKHTPLSRLDEMRGSAFPHSLGQGRMHRWSLQWAIFP